MRSRRVLDLGLSSIAATVYDRLTFMWSAERTVEGVTTQHNDAFSDRTARAPTFTYPDVSVDDASVPFTVTCVVTAHGDGGVAKQGTSDSFSPHATTHSRHVAAAETAAGIGVYVTDEAGNEIVIDAMFPNAQEAT